MSKSKKQHQKAKPPEEVKEEPVKKEWKSNVNIKWGKFPGPAQVQTALRVAIDKTAYGDFILHAHSALDSEVCGVLAGNVYEDDEGIFLHIHAVIRGNSAKQGTTHVTFTQETWNSIHSTLEKDYPNLMILGWYHTHPGFGVEFSDMDLFIQRNFFPLQTQIGLLMDPLQGKVAVCINTEGGDGGTACIGQLCVDGRMLHCYTPEAESADGVSGVDSRFMQKFELFETRFNQFVESADKQKRTFYSFLITGGITLLLAVVLFFGFTVFQNLSLAANLKPGGNGVTTEPLKVQVGNEIIDFSKQPYAIPVTTRVGDKIIYLDILLRGVVASERKEGR